MILNLVIRIIARTIIRRGDGPIISRYPRTAAALSKLPTFNGNESEANAFLNGYYRGVYDVIRLRKSVTR